MKLKLRTLLALTPLTLLGLTSLPTYAADPPEAALAFNVGVTSDYRYRGLSQTRLKPALQGGVDYSHPSGFYLGAWASSIKWIKDWAATDGSLEIDLYAGYKGEIAKDLTFDVGYLRYEYPGNKLANVAGFGNANTQEVYGALSYGPATLKYSHSLSNLFGTLDSHGSGYLDLSATFDLGSGWSLLPHVGRQRVAHDTRNARMASYTDYSLTLSKDLGDGLVLSAAAVTSNANQVFYTAVPGKFPGKSGLVVGLKYGF